MRVKNENKKHYTADFETLVLDEESITKGKPTYVWAWALCDIDNIEDVKYGTSINTFFTQLEKLRSGSVVYFHNLKYDGQFIIPYLLKNKYTQLSDARKMLPRSYTTLVSEIGIWYNIKVKFQNKKTIEINDSLKKLPFSVKALAKQLGLPEQKGEIDYKKYRKEGGILSEEDKDYIRRDVQIVARSLKEICFSNDLYKMTIGSDCMNYYKSITPNFKEIFPQLPKEVDEFCRMAYKGGYCYVNPKIQGKKLTKIIGSTYDYNSMYPSVMHSQSGYRYPIGEGEYYCGNYEIDWLKPLFIQHIRASFKLKKGKIPTIQIKNNFSFKENEYIEESLIPVDLYLTKPDYIRFIEHYDIYSFEAIDGYKFAEMDGLFDEYIDHWYKVKEDATRTGNKVQRLVSKLFLNNLYGKFATGTNASKQEFYLDDDGITRHTLIEEEKDGVYVPVGAFITAYARKELFDAIQANYDCFCYCDTDSIHLTKPEAKGIKVHDSALGYWKKESEWAQAKFLRQKTYAEYIFDPKTNSYNWEYKACGMNDEVKENIPDIDAFEVGATFSGKKLTKRVPGGVVITETTFKILPL